MVKAEFLEFFLRILLVIIESMNIASSIKEATINAIDGYPLCQNLTKNNIT